MELAPRLAQDTGTLLCLRELNEKSIKKIGGISTGVYHLMGLGRSPGAVIGPISYLSYRYNRWNAEDQRFFARSGEIKQRQHGQVVGDIQSLVFFTTRDVLTAKDESGKTFHAYNYIDNRSGQSRGAEQQGGPMRDTLKRLLKQEWPSISGGRKASTIFWCEVDRRDTHSTYERIVRVMAALGAVGGQGKEVWANLTGGNNVINFAMQLAATLSGKVARLYYVQAEDSTAEKCLRFTSENGYWVDMPMMPLDLSEINLGVLDTLDQDGPLNVEKLYGRLTHSEKYWNLFSNINSSDSFKDIILTSMWKQGLIAESEKGCYTIGPQWELIQPYRMVLQTAKTEKLSIEELAKKLDWIEKDDIDF